MKAMPSPVQQLLIGAAADAALAVRHAVSSLPVDQRIRKVPTPLKPPPAVAALPDLVGEQAAFAALASLGPTLDSEVRVIIDPASGQYHTLESPNQDMNGTPHTHAHTPSTFIYCYLDAVDGTVKLSGLGNTPGTARVINDNAWAIGIAFTEPTTMSIADLKIGDFSVACIVDGAAPLPSTSHHPSTQDSTRTSTNGQDHPRPDLNQQATYLHTTASPSFPTAAVAFRKSTSQSSEEPFTYQTHAMVFPHLLPQSDAQGCNHDAMTHRACMTDGQSVLGPRLYASTCTQLNQVFAYLDGFQAFDRASQAPSPSARRHRLIACLLACLQKPGDEQLVVSLYSALINRHEGGAFDVLRTYGNLSALLRTMLGWGPGDTTKTLGTAATVPEPGVMIEPQCGVYVVVNENLANLIPCVPIVLGAQGLATSLSQSPAPLTCRRLADGRTSILYAANGTLQKALLHLLPP